MNRLAPRVLVIDRRAVIGTEICRAESAHGCKVDVFAEPESPVFRSRFCDRRFVMHGLDEPAFAAELSSVASAHQYDAIYVCNEEVLARIVALSAGANWRGLLIPPPDLLKIALSKNATLSLVASAGVPVPMTVIPNDEDDLRTFGRRFSLPIIVKGDTGESGQNIEVVSKIDDLVGAYRAVLARETRPGSKPAVQEFIPGFSYSLGALVHRGRPLRVVSYRKLIKYPPPWGGLTVKGITERDPQLLAEGFKVFEAFQYSGIGHVEFIRDSRDGHFKFLEINPRIWGSIAVARWAGRARSTACCSSASSRSPTAPAACACRAATSKSCRSRTRPYAAFG